MYNREHDSLAASPSKLHAQLLELKQQASDKLVNICVYVMHTYIKNTYMSVAFSCTLY